VSAAEGGLSDDKRQESKLRDGDLRSSGRGGGCLLVWGVSGERVGAGPADGRGSAGRCWAVVLRRWGLCIGGRRLGAWELGDGS
jgi:hypothetical protein